MIEDTEVRSVHTLNLPDPAQAHMAAQRRCARDIHIGAVLDSVKDFEPQWRAQSEMPNSDQAFCPAACHASDRRTRPRSRQPGSPTPEKPAVPTTRQTRPSATRRRQPAAPAEKSKWTASRDPLRPGPGSRDRPCGDRRRVADSSRRGLAGRLRAAHGGRQGRQGGRPRAPGDDHGQGGRHAERLPPTPSRWACPRPGQGRPAACDSALPIPALPSRSLPQGIHADGTPAELPPLPDDDKAEPSANDSAEPRPSPQKPRAQPARRPAAKPASPTDGKATKASFTLPRAVQAGRAAAVRVPNLQFMMPLKPFALKLPFNQKLELELIGRVVADTEATSRISADGVIGSGT